MDKTIINLLFNHKGTISSREFRAGMTIVFMSLGCYMYIILNNFIPNIIIREAEQVASYAVYSPVMSSYIPQIVPIGFITTVSSFLLAFKRMRTFFDNKAILILSGVLNFLLFSSIIVPILLLLTYIGLVFSGEILEIFFQNLLIVNSIILVLGFINMAFLAIPGKSEPSITKPTTTGLDILRYTLKIGNLIGVLMGIHFLFAIKLAFQELSMLVEDEAAYLLISLLIILFGFYIKYSASRLKDAGISVLWLVGVLVGYIIFVAMTIRIGFHKSGLFYFILNTIFSIATSFFLASQYLLLLLPTKKNKMGDSGLDNRIVSTPKI